MHLISILGPTSSGKTDLSILLAKRLQEQYGKYSCVIISTDSRQIYQYLNLGTGKIEGVWDNHEIFGKCFLYQNIPHFLIDKVDPMFQYSLNDYLNDYLGLFDQWTKINHLPQFVILCGGTGLYAKAILEEYQLEKIKQIYINDFDHRRAELNQQDVSKLQQILITLSPTTFQKLNQSDQNNPRRLINHILKLESHCFGWVEQVTLKYPKFQTKQQFYLNPDDLIPKIELRLKQRLQSGMMTEIENLLKLKIITPKKLLDLGLEYTQFYYYYYGITTRQEYEKLVFVENKQYVKRQLTWFKKQKDLVLVSGLDDLWDNLKI